MKYAAVLLLAFACSGAFASEPGSPLGCEDWTGVAPGLTFEEDEGVAFGALLATATDRVALDNEGGRIIIGGASTLTPPTPCGAGGLPLVRATTGNALEVLACVGSRQNPVAGYSDSAIQWNSGCYYPTPAPAGGCVRFNPITGDLFFSFLRMGTGYADSPIWCVMHGLTTLYDVQQTYTPQASLGFRVPVMPEGLAGADHFDTYWGHLSTVGDWSQAHPLQCGYPAAAPHVGDYLTVADTVPTPVPGRGIYYVTAATYQGATRYGRKTTAGHLSGRDPAVLPVCNAATAVVSGRPQR